ncbi:MAG: hypothetical protein VB024_10770 [Dysgonamonadaceae bacterium]|nr:hypothetical protein [Dysgonamonadaceae bacterium]
MAIPNIDSETSILAKVLKWGGLISLAGAIFTGGYQAGCYISDIKCSENNIKAIGEFQRERESLKDEIEKYKLSNINYATKEELEELKNNFDEFYKLNHE